METDLKFKINNTDLKKLTNIQLNPEERLDILHENYENLEGLCKRLKTNPKTGLSSFDQNDIKIRKEKFGINELPKEKPKTFFSLIMIALNDKLLIVLIICAVISILISYISKKKSCTCAKDLGNIESNRDGFDNPSLVSNKKNQPEWIEGFAILIAVIVVTLVTAFNNWTKDKQFRNLQSKIESENKISVLRDNNIQEINPNELLVGDIGFLKYGNLVPADAIIFYENDLKIDESALTGESELVKKSSNNDPFLFNSTQVMEGSAKFLVLAVGLNTQSGLIMSMMTNIEDSTGHSLLQMKLEKQSAITGLLGIFMSISTVIVLSVRFLMTTETSLLTIDLIAQRLFEYIIIGITVLVVAIPEGMPLAVTLSLAYAVKKMIQDNNLVRHLDACETMGSATTICTDKTGTLTTNRMTVTQCYLNNNIYKKFPITDDDQIITDEIKVLISNAIAINSNYTSQLLSSVIPGHPDTHIGNQTECSLLGIIKNLNMDYEQIRLENPCENFEYVYTFNSDRKCMATCIHHPTIPGGIRIFCKGAPEIILKKSKFILEKNEMKELSENKILEISDVLSTMSGSGLRTIAIAYKDYSDTELPELFDWSRDENRILDGFNLLCICGNQDPIRKEVPEAIRKCQDAGIIVRMVTGDNLDTARSIAIECGIIKPNDEFIVMEGKDFDEKIRNETGQISQEKFDKIWPYLRVLARSSPQNKYDLVKYMINSRLNTSREVVAVTGDGTNDGPALKIADVGFAMGIQGTDIAKEASDIILTDDNFDSIVKAVAWGRNVYDSIAKFIQFQATVNFVAVFCVFIGACFGLKSLNSIQMLWINLIMDSFASLALATDPPSSDLLKRKPYGRTSPLISPIMTKNICLHAIYQIIVIMVLLLKADKFIQFNDNIQINQSKQGCVCDFEAASQHMTLVFNTFVIMTLFNEINSRKIHGEHNVFKGILKNQLFIWIWISSFVTQVIIVNYGAYGFSCTPLSLEQWIWSFIFGIGCLVWAQIITLIPLEKLAKKNTGPKIEKEIFKINKLKSQSEKSSRIHWFRGYNKLQTELKVIRAFRNGTSWTHPINN